MADDRVVYDNGRIHVECWAIESDALYPTFAAKAGLSGAEMIQLSADGLHRARTWHWFRHGALEKVTLLCERRVGSRAVARG